MCGITGMLGHDRTGAIHIIHTMTRALRHRGPDGEGYVWFRDVTSLAQVAGGAETAEDLWDRELLYAPRTHVEDCLSATAQIALGHRRLAILDLSATGHQPMCDPSAGSWIVYNGEVYNFPEIRRRLEGLGRRFVSESDTEVILAAYQEWGEECLGEFNGMWAFAIWDRSRGTLFAARDRFGVKPFYYCFDEQFFLFASEIKALLASGMMERNVNEQRLFEYLERGLTDHSSETLFANVSQLLPGHFLKLRLDDWKLEISPYYELRTEQPSLHRQGEKALAASLRSRLEDAVRLRLISDVPVGTCLSGGLDSTSVACLLHRFAHQDGLRCPDYQRTFSVVYGNAEMDETPYIDEVVRTIHSKHDYTTVTAQDLLRDLQQFVGQQDEPFDKIGVFAQWQVYKLVHSCGVKVTLDGQGGDELFAGYDDYFADYYDLLLRQKHLATWCRELAAYAVHHGITNAGAFVPTWRRAARSVIPQWVFPSRPARSEIAPCPFPWLSKDFWFEWQRRRAASADGDRRLATLGQRLRYSVQVESIPHSLRLCDRNAMAHSVESRFPFLDYRLVEWAFSLPDRLKIRFGQTKYILRQAVRGVMPERVRRRQDKMGFYLVLSEWLRREPLRSFVLDMAESSSAGSRPYFDPEGCRQGVRRFLEGGPYHHFWRWLNTELWLRQRVDQASRVAGGVR
jgi:asparagine synthase (glutamine-hydrolysing)